MPGKRGNDAGPGVIESAFGLLELLSGLGRARLAELLGDLAPGGDGDADHAGEPAHGRNRTGGRPVPSGDAPRGPPDGA